MYITFYENLQCFHKYHVKFMFSKKAIKTDKIFTIALTFTK